jgi:hypothetical protein
MSNHNQTWTMINKSKRARDRLGLEVPDYPAMFGSTGTLVMFGRRVVGIFGSIRLSGVDPGPGRGVESLLE